MRSFLRLVTAGAGASSLTFLSRVSADRTPSAGTTDREHRLQAERRRQVLVFGVISLPVRSTAVDIDTLRIPAGLGSAVAVSQARRRRQLRLAEDGCGSASRPPSIARPARAPRPPDLGLTARLESSARCRLAFRGRRLRRPSMTVRRRRRGRGLARRPQGRREVTGRVEDRGVTARACLLGGWSAFQDLRRLGMATSSARGSRRGGARAGSPPGSASMGSPALAAKQPSSTEVASCSDLRLLPSRLHARRGRRRRQHVPRAPRRCATRSQAAEHAAATSHESRRSRLGAAYPNAVFSSLPPFGPRISSHP